MLTLGRSAATKAQFYQTLDPMMVNAG